MATYKVFMTGEITYSAYVEADSEDEALELADNIENWEFHDESGGDVTSADLVKQ